MEKEKDNEEDDADLLCELSATLNNMCDYSEAKGNAVVGIYICCYLI